MLTAQPLTFAAEFSLSKNSEVPGAYRRNDGSWVYKTKFELICDKWSQGPMLHFKVYEYSSYEAMNEDIRKVHEVKIWGNKFINEDNKDFEIIPSGEQTLLMEALSSGDARGEYAQSIAHNLFVDMILLNPKSGMKKLYPKLVEFYEKAWAKYNWERKSK